MQQNTPRERDARCLHETLFVVLFLGGALPRDYFMFMYEMFVRLSYIDFKSHEV